MKKKIGITLAVIALLVCIISVVCLAGCNEKVTAEKAQEATEANWAKIDGKKTATTTIKIDGAEIALGVDGDEKAASITAGAEVKLTRTWENGELTINIEAHPTNIDFNLDGIPGVEDILFGKDGLLNAYVNMSKLKDLKFTGTAFYKYGSEDKTIGVKDLKVSGLASALPIVVSSNPDANITDAEYAIKFMNNKTGKYEPEVSFNLDGIDLSMVDSFGIFKKGYSLDLVGIIEDLLLNQTLLDFESDSASYADGSYSSTVSFTNNFNFVKDVWNNIDEKTGMTALNTLLGNATIDVSDMGTEGDPSDDVKIELGSVLKKLLGKDTFNTLIDDVLGLFSGKMTTTGKVEDGIFTSLTSTLSDVKLSLDKDQVAAITDEVSRVISALAAGGKVDPTVSSLVPTVINAIAGGEAYISLGRIVVSSSFNVA